MMMKIDDDEEGNKKPKKKKKTRTSIHDEKNVPTCFMETINDSRTQTTILMTNDAFDSAKSSLTDEFGDFFGCLVRAVVIHHDDFMWNALRVKNLCQSFDQW